MTAEHDWGWRAGNVACHVEAWSEKRPDQPALIFDGMISTYQTLNQAIDWLARALVARGVAKGDRIGLMLGNSPAFIHAYLASLKIGAIAVTLNPRLSAEELAPILANCAPKILVVSPLARANPPAVPADTILLDLDEHGALADAARATDQAAPGQPALSLPPETPAAIVYTSGTTAAPKGVTLSHANIISNMQAKQQLLGITPEDRALLFLPLFHCFGQNAVLNAVLQSGACLELHPDFSPERVMEAVKHHGITLFFGVPATFALLLDRDPADFAGVRFFFSAAAKLSVELEKKWRARFGAPIYQGYGLSETSPFATYNHAERHKPGSVGEPIPGVSLRVVSPWTGQDVATGETGEIWIKGPNVMLGYWGRPEATAAAIQAGWLRTGDLGWRDADGYLQLLDRLDDVIIVGGQNVCPAEIEDVLYRHPAVRDAAVFGVGHASLGEVVAAQVCLADGATDTGALLALCREALAEYKIPRRIEVVEAIPRSPSGKILKRVLRAAAAPIRVATEHAPEAARVEQWLTTWLAEHLSTEAAGIDPEQAFADLGVSSLGLVMLMTDLGDWSGQALPAATPWTYPNVRELARHIADLAKPREGEGGMAAAASADSPAREATARSEQPGAEIHGDGLDSRASLMAELDEMENLLAGLDARHDRGSRS